MLAWPIRCISSRVVAIPEVGGQPGQLVQHDDDVRIIRRRDVGAGGAHVGGGAGHDELLTVASTLPQNIGHSALPPTKLTDVDWCGRAPSRPPAGRRPSLETQRCCSTGTRQSAT